MEINLPEKVKISRLQLQGLVSERNELYKAVQFILNVTDYGNLPDVGKINLIKDICNEILAEME